ncbi:MAG: NAD-dependent epimerase/dehydratase family protein [Flavobacteriales bacterium]
MNLITGATGLLGTHLILELLQNGQSVRALKRENSNTEIVRDILDFYAPGHRLFEKVEWVVGDVMDVESLLSAMEGIEFVYHTAAVVSYHRKDWDQMYRVNVHGTGNVVNAAYKSGIRKLCHVSSIAALGKVKPGQWINEAEEWKDSDLNTHYGISKHESEMEVWRGVQEGLNAIVVNPGFIIGPGDFDRSSPSVFSKLNEGLNYYPPGGTGFVCATDCAKAMRQLMQSEKSNEGYILVAENLSMKYLFQEINKNLGKSGPEKEASSLIMQLARIAEWLKEKFSGKKAVITRETVKNASVQFYYKNDKIKEAIDLEFTPVSKGIELTAAYFRSKNR